MKITKEQLKRIIQEIAMGHGMMEYEADERARDEIATQIRNASKDIHGRKDVYDLKGKSMEELEDILYDLSNSQEQREMDDMARDKMEDQMGRDQELSRSEMAPRRQGMGRRPSGSKSQRRMENKIRITKKQLQRIISEEANKLINESLSTKARKDSIVLERKLRREVRKALIESGGRLDEGFFSKIASALGKLGMVKIPKAAIGAYKKLQQKLGNDKEIPGIDGLMGPMEDTMKMAEAILDEMKDNPVTFNSSDEEKAEIQEKVAKMMQNFGKFLQQELEGGGVTVLQAMEIAPSQKKQSEPHQAYEEVKKVWKEINSIYSDGKRRKEKDQLVQYDKKLDYKLIAPYKGSKKLTQQ